MGLLKSATTRAAQLELASVRLQLGRLWVYGDMDLGLVERRGDSHAFEISGEEMEVSAGNGAEAYTNAQSSSSLFLSAESGKLLPESRNRLGMHNKRHTQIHTTHTPTHTGTH